MPSAILPNQGLAALLDYLVRSPIPGVLPWKLMLFKNNIVPTASTVLADLVEATFAGYSAVDLVRGDWTVPTVNAGCARSTWGTNPVSWTVAAPNGNTIYGYAFRDPTAQVLRLVQRFDDEDIAPLVTGQVFSMLPEFTLTTATCGA